MDGTCGLKKIEVISFHLFNINYTTCVDCMQHLCYNIIIRRKFMKDTLGKVISNRREELGISQRELAKKVKISNSTVSRLENDDKITPDNNTLKAISEVLQIDYNYLLALNKQIDDEPEIRIIQRAARNMDQGKKEEMLKVLKKHFEEEFGSADGDMQ